VKNSMKEYEAKRLLEITFSQEFDPERFIDFLKELFNQIEINPSNKSVYIAQEYKDYIETIIKLGEYEDAKKNVIEILAIKLRNLFSIDRARTMQRNFIANWLGKSDKSAALVAFYGDNENWRFSFVKMEYQLTQEGDVKKDLTPAKRYSFLIGKNEPNHTCKSRFLKLLMEEKINPSLDELEEAFSIDNVTKEFFLQYKERFLELKESLEKIVNKDSIIKKEFDSKGISTTDFSKKLLGQIVFIYFLQKKGWLGVEKDEKGSFKQWGNGPKDFIKKLFNKEIVDYKNFFNDILEPLFYDALANPRDGDDGYYKLFDCKIPFLNGGLFEPINDYDWSRTGINIENEIFQNILRTFDRFNFTVKEDESLEKEVAVDPEMLGKVFENLLEVKDRKSKGAFYTPREIVYYMCQQSLINYLETNTQIDRKDIEKFIEKGDLILAQIIREEEQIKKSGRAVIDEKYVVPKSIRDNYLQIDNFLKEIKIVDPAVGSGAFLVGIMNEIVKARSILTVFFKETEQKNRVIYNLKRDVIENCLYGVDIEPSATEITKLRFWLSLIVDELDMKNIKPLPNLDHKIMCGNSLLEEFEGIKLFDERLLGEINKYNNISETKKIGNEIDRLSKERGEIIKGTYKGEKTLKNLDDEINKLKKKKDILTNTNGTSKTISLNEVLQRRIKESEKRLINLKVLQKKFFSEQNRKEKRRLREEIDEIEWKLIEETLKEQGHDDAIKKLSQYKKNKVKPFFLWKLYFSEVFQRKNPGFDVVIGNPPWEKFKPLDPEFFTNYCEYYRELSKSEQKSTREKLLKNSLIKTSYISYIKKYRNETNSFKKYYKLQGTGDLNLYKLFLEKAYQISSNIVAFLIPGQITIDNGSIEFRKTFLKDRSLWRIIGLINRKGLFENVHLEQRFVLLFLDKKSRHDMVETYGWSYYFKDFKNTQLLKLSTEFFNDFDENKTYYLDINKLNYDIFDKIKRSPISSRLKKMGYHIWREYDVTLDSKYFNDKKGLYKLFSGQAINHFDCMSKTWIENHGRSSRWKKVEFPKIKNYRTEYFVNTIPKRIIEHHDKNKSNFRIVTQTVTGAVTNARTVNAAILPKKYLTNNSLNNLFIGNCDEELFYYLAVLDSFIVDWQIRSKIATNLNKFILDSILVPKFEKIDQDIRENIWKNSIRLSAVSEDFNEITQKYFKKDYNEIVVSDHEKRQELKNEIDYLVAKIWGLNKEEIKNILNSFPLIQPSIKSDILRRFIE